MKIMLTKKNHMLSLPFAILAMASGMSVQASNIQPNAVQLLSIKDNPWKYSQYYTDAESGLNYCMARYYCSELMSFITRDTYNVPNRYNYCGNNAVMNTDSNGHMFARFSGFNPYKTYSPARLKECPQVDYRRIYAYGSTEDILYKKYHMYKMCNYLTEVYIKGANNECYQVFKKVIRNNFPRDICVKNLIENDPGTFDIFKKRLVDEDMWNVYTYDISIKGFVEVFYDSIGRLFESSNINVESLLKAWADQNGESPSGIINNVNGFLRSTSGGGKQISSLTIPDIVGLLRHWGMETSPEDSLLHSQWNVFYSRPPEYNERQRVLRTNPIPESVRYALEKLGKSVPE